ncbi:MAG: TolC family protein [Cytophagales bacterium]|nr:TolC family protein [Cytophagales bacterium]MCA6369484.1 TolC family protein [Cytophagales bacterium]MCA6373212.1 TolC family protein [Cytophagales bacterium]MCA6376361.1 TolC family protein [Cytophagales bacterium]MCA6383620.1 TolC family protein [Cytophagales bacterium]
MLVTSVLTACGLQLVAFSTSNAQDTLSLARAVQIGLQNNFGVQIQKLNVEAASLNNNWGQAGLLPSINLTGSQNNSVVERKPANPFAVAGRNVSNNVLGQLDIQFTLFDGFAVSINKKRLEQLETLSKGNATFVMENTVQAIILSYYQAGLEMERLQVLVKNREYSKERYVYVKLKKSLGSAISFDVLQEQNNYLTDSANVLRQEIVVKNSVRNLNVLLNEDINRTYQFTDPLEFEEQVYQYNDLKAKMVQSNTNLRNQFISQELFHNATRSAQANLSPTLLLNLGGTGSLDQLNANFRTNTGNQIENTVGFVNRDTNQPVYLSVNETTFAPLTQTGNSYGGYANLSLRFTLFNGGQLRRTIDNAQIQEKIAKLTTDQLKLSLENSLLATFDLYNLRRQLVSIAQTKLQAAELNLALANERYKNGALSAIDLRIVQENFRSSALEKVAAIFDGLSSRIELVRLTGGLVDNVR